MDEVVVSRRLTTRRRLIERPRLTRVLDESTARISMLAAPAGYGKTTLARQWLADTGHRHAWFSCRGSSADVAALAEGLVTAVRPLVPAFGTVVLERLSATGNPAHEVDVIAEIMLEELEPWPPGAWLVIDDYHHVSHSPPAELLLGELAGFPALNLLVLGRTRPTWATARRVIYGEILEIGRADLAMTDAEAHELLAPAGATAGLEQLQSSGWPALLGLAALAGDVLGDEPLPPSVYDFLAEELFATLTPPAKQAVLAIVLMPRMEREIARELLGEQADAALAEASAAGMIELSEGGSPEIEMHPLIREFLLAKRDSTASIYAKRLFALLVAQHRWDEALALVQGFIPERFEELMRAALPELLSRARIQTLETWLAFAERAGLGGPASDHAMAELALREGSYVEAYAASQALARRLPDKDELKTRVLLLAGRSAHLASLERESLAAYRVAKGIAQDTALRKQATWGEISAAVDLELPEADRLLEEADATCDSLEDIVNHAMNALMRDYRWGNLKSLDKARGLRRSSERIRDPLLRCSFLSGLASALAIAGAYDECLETCDVLLSNARRHRLEFVVSYGLASAAISHAGLRDHAEAFRKVGEAAAIATRLRDRHSILNCEVIQSQTHFSLGEHVEAYRSLTSDSSGAIPSMEAEVVASKGLALAALGRFRDAEAHASQARALSSSIEACLLVPGIEAICAARADPAAAPATVDALLAKSLESGNVHSLVMVYRGVPDLLAFASTEALADLLPVMSRARDDELMRVLNVFDSKRRMAHEGLSRRELEVAGLIAEGLTNKEIGARLFISPATAKLHVRHILGKLGVRTRTEAALRLAAMRQSGDARD